MSEVTAIRLAWLAGILDGEGSICLFRRTDTKTSVSIYPNITVTNTNANMLNEIKSMLDSLEVKYSFNNPGTHGPGKKQIRRVSIRNYAAIIRLLQAVLPHLVAKREQGELMLSHCEKAGMKGASLTEERWQNHQKMHELNKRSFAFL